MNDGLKVECTHGSLFSSSLLKKVTIKLKYMAAEKKTKGVKIETIGSASLKRKFKTRCKKLNVSMAQRLRDLVQKDIKGI